MVPIAVAKALPPSSKAAWAFCILLLKPFDQVGKGVGGRELRSVYECREAPPDDHHRSGCGSSTELETFGTQAKRHVWQQSNGVVIEHIQR